ncbi:hypothetical protein ES703_50910 [subsurface metagenome]
MIKRIVLEIVSRIAYKFEVNRNLDTKFADWLYSRLRDIEDWAMR